MKEYIIMITLPENAIEEPIIESPLTPTDIKTKPKSWYILGLFLLTLTIILGSSIFYKFRNRKIEMEATPNPSASPTPKPVPLLLLQRKENEGWKDVASFSGLTELKILKWGDYLFYGSMDDPGVYVHNLQTGNTTTIMALEDKRAYINDILIADNDLYFSVGGYMIEGGTYHLSLPPIDQPTKMITSHNGSFRQIGDHTWIASGEGDGCGGITKYFLLNTNSSSAREIFDSSSGCRDGEQFIGIDKRDRVILSYHENYQDVGMVEYTSVMSLPVTNPTAKTGMITKETMPKGTTNVQYIKGVDKLLLVSDKFYFYNISEAKIDQSIAIPEKWLNFNIIESTDKFICLSRDNIEYSYDGVENLYASIDLANNKFVDNDQTCKQYDESWETYRASSETKARQQREYIDKLELPENYRFDRQ